MEESRIAYLDPCRAVVAFLLLQLNFGTNQRHFLRTDVCPLKIDLPDS